MAKFRARCPSCRGYFPWDPALGSPSKCPLPGCEYVSVTRADDDVVMPFIRSQKTTRTDASYRELETSSAMRAQLAADMAGVPVSEMSHLKVTNLKDNTREGEIAAMPVVNDVTKQMERMKAMGAPVGFGAAQGQPVETGTATGAITLNGQVIQGIQPRAGSRAMDATHNTVTQVLGNRSYQTKRG